jgi:hypothetical protein
MRCSLRSFYSHPHHHHHHHHHMSSLFGGSVIISLGMMVVHPPLPSAFHLFHSLSLFLLCLMIEKTFIEILFRIKKIRFYY